MASPATPSALLLMYSAHCISTMFSLVHLSCLSSWSIKDGLVSTLTTQQPASQSAMNALPGELHLVVRVLDSLTDIVNKHNHQQDSGSLMSMCATDALLDWLMDIVKTELVAILTPRRGSPWPYLAALESLTSLLCSRFLKGVLQTVCEDFNRCS